MRIVVTGATGNVGTSLLSALCADQEVESIVGIARRRPAWEPEKVEWIAADVGVDDLDPIFRGADAVVHLAWQIQPSRNLRQTQRTNVQGSERVFRAAADAGVQSLIYASSIGAYSPGPKDPHVDESWPTDGVPSSFYSRHKALVETALDRFEAERPDVRVVRLRPGLIFKGPSGTEIRRLFAGPLLPSFLIHRRFVPLVPELKGRLVFQAVHADDVAEAFRLAIRSEVSGAFNVAAEPVLDATMLARVLDARPVRMPSKALRAAASLSWRLRLQPTPPGWLDMALEVPVMDTRRVREELGWTPKVAADDALLELMDGMRHSEGFPTPPLDPAASGPLRWHEWRTRVGGRAF